MIDKVEVRVPAHTPFGEEFSSLYADVRGSENDVFHESEHYTAVGDLRQFGISARLHVGVKHGKIPNHKLELIDSGTMGYSRIVHEVSQVFELKQKQILGLETTRVDLCADVPGVPVSWFRENVRAQFKRFGAELGEYTEMGQKGVETLYFGKRPNCFRVYDKIAEFKYQHKRLTRKVSPDAEIPDFAETWGVPENDYILTRVERQIGGGRIPTQISNLARLKNAPDFNPFERLKFHAAGGVLPQRGDDDFVSYCAGLWMRQVYREMGQFQFHRWLSSQTGSNFQRTYKRFSRYLPASEGEGVTPADLYERYRHSVSRQLAA